MRHPSAVESPERKSGWRRRLSVTGGIALVLLAMILVPTLYLAGNFEKHVDAFSRAAQAGDTVRARQELGTLESFYALSKKWKMAWVGRRFFFRDARLYEAAYQTTIGDYEKAAAAVAESTDYRAYHRRGTAKFHEAEAAYLAGAKASAVMPLVEDAKSAYEQAVRVGPNTDFDDKWNYDLAAAILNGDLTMEQMMASREGQRKPVKLGMKGKEKGPGSLGEHDGLNRKGTKSTGGKRRG